MTCKECARFSAEVVQNLPGFDEPGMRSRRYGHYWGPYGQAREARVCDHIM